MFLDCLVGSEWYEGKGLFWDGKEFFPWGSRAADWLAGWRVRRDG